MPTTIYLDNNATTRPRPEVLEAMNEHWRASFANPGSHHALGRSARRALEDARETMASILQADTSEIIFTSGGTESTNLALLGFAQATSPGGILLTAGEHLASLECCRTLERDREFWLQFLDVDSNGRLQHDQLLNLDASDLRMATVILAHNETGVVQELRLLAEFCRERGVPLHVDAVQAVGKIPVSFAELGCTAMSLAAHKFHGPRGIGALLLRRGTKLPPLLRGGHQESEHRPGTEPVALAVGMAKALELWHGDQTTRTQHMQQRRDELQVGLLKSIPHAVVNGIGAERLPNTLNISFVGVDAEALLVNLDLAGICCSLGSTCASGSTMPNQALVAMGLSEDVYRSAIRFSVSFETTSEEIQLAIERISRIVERMLS
ncbi:cysteine desulfurase family protein [Thalassoroseus pseudoceratinae]|uniref:cysteine desulfurase family protein n=1 Tax=Thalassoroseus pseudoceratinae TaxID=2713176 RepID=UPI0014232807|nr:cysteine desulfurase family protein [Thalassoroseus pseudoceratinae]